MPLIPHRIPLIGYGAAFAASFGAAYLASHRQATPSTASAAQPAAGAASPAASSGSGSVWDAFSNPQNFPAGQQGNSGGSVPTPVPPDQSGACPAGYQLDASGSVCVPVTAPTPPPPAPAPPPPVPPQPIPPPTGSTGSTAAPHHNFRVIHTTQLWNDQTGQWRYTLPVGTTGVVRGAGYTKGGVGTYPVVAVPSVGISGGLYYIPRANVVLTS